MSLLVLSSCAQIQSKGSDVEKDSLTQNSIDSLYPVIRYYALDKKQIRGDFNGDGKLDTLFQNNINLESGMPIDSLPELPEWENMLSYLDEHYSNIIVTYSKNQSDTLYLGAGFGLFCFINLGDLNHDKKDEFAFVTENADYSRVNHCYIYTLCHNKFTQLKSFYIYEGTFDSYDTIVPKANEITNFLEKQNGKWMYSDYLEDMEYENEKDVGKLKVLKLKKCN